MILRNRRAFSIFVLATLFVCVPFVSRADERLKDWTLDEKIGQLFMLGFRSFDQIEKVKPGGVVLFSWSLKDVDKAKKLISELKNRPDLKAPLFIATDHEGGRVVRLRKGLTLFPDAMALGATENKELAFKAGKTMGLELSSLGFNMNLAPVLDIGNGKSFLENRIWGSDPNLVSEMTGAFIEGLHSEKIIAVAKHFPGHGGTTVDSHFDLPVIKKSWSEFWKTDLVPFRRAVEKGLDAMMSAHVEVSDVSSEPASVSQKFITQVLREQLNFKGLIITDDLEMGGLSQKLGASVEDLALKAIAAGTDMVMVVWSWEIQEKIFDRIKRAVLEKQIPESLIDQRVSHILAIKEKWLNYNPEHSTGPKWKKNLRTPQAQQLVTDIRLEAMKWVTSNEDEVMKDLRLALKSPWQVLVPSPSVKKFWAKSRNQDEIEIINRRPDLASLSKMKETIDSAIGQKKPLIIVTQPLATLGSETLNQIMKTLGQAEKEKRIQSPVLWLHQGASPVNIKNSSSLKTGLVALHSSSIESLKLFYQRIEKTDGSEFE